MKIYHRVKITREEQDALETTANMIRMIRDDAMLNVDFADRYGYDFDDVASTFYAFKEFLESYTKTSGFED